MSFSRAVLSDATQVTTKDPVMRKFQQAVKEAREPKRGTFGPLASFQEEAEGQLEVTSASQGKHFIAPPTRIRWSEIPQYYAKEPSAAVEEKENNGNNNNNNNHDDDDDNRNANEKEKSELEKAEEEGKRKEESSVVCCHWHQQNVLSLIHDDQSRLFVKLCRHGDENGAAKEIEEDQSRDEKQKNEKEEGEEEEEKKNEKKEEGEENDESAKKKKDTDSDNEDKEEDTIVDIMKLQYSGAAAPIYRSHYTASCQQLENEKKKQQNKNKNKNNKEGSEASSSLTNTPPRNSTATNDNDEKELWFSNVWKNQPQEYWVKRALSSHSALLGRCYSIPMQMHEEPIPSAVSGKKCQEEGVSVMRKTKQKVQKKCNSVLPQQRCFNVVITPNHECFVMNTLQEYFPPIPEENREEEDRSSGSNKNDNEEDANKNNKKKKKDVIPLPLKVIPILAPQVVQNVEAILQERGAQQDHDEAEGDDTASKRRSIASSLLHPRLILPEVEDFSVCGQVGTENVYFYGGVVVPRGEGERVGFSASSPARTELSFVSSLHSNNFNNNVPPAAAIGTFSRQLMKLSALSGHLAAMPNHSLRLPPGVAGHSAVIYQNSVLFLFGGFLEAHEKADPLGCFSPQRKNRQSTSSNSHRRASTAALNSRGESKRSADDDAQKEPHEEEKEREGNSSLVAVVVIDDNTGGDPITKPSTMDQLQPPPPPTQQQPFPNNTSSKKRFIGNGVYNYNIDTNVWKHVTCTGDVPTGRVHHEASLCNDWMLVTGGVGENPLKPLRDVYMLQCKLHLWVKVESESRHALSSTALHHFCFWTPKYLCVLFGKGGTPSSSSSASSLQSCEMSAVLKYASTKRNIELQKLNAINESTGKTTLVLRSDKQINGAVARLTYQNKLPTKLLDPRVQSIIEQREQRQMEEELGVEGPAGNGDAAIPLATEIAHKTGGNIMVDTRHLKLHPLELRECTTRLFQPDYMANKLTRAENRLDDMEYQRKIRRMKENKKLKKGGGEKNGKGDPEIALVENTAISDPKAFLRRFYDHPTEMMRFRQEERRVALEKKKGDAHFVEDLSVVCNKLYENAAGKKRLAAIEEKLKPPFQPFRRADLLKELKAKREGKEGQGEEEGKKGNKEKSRNKEKGSPPKESPRKGVKSPEKSDDQSPPSGRPETAPSTSTKMPALYQRLIEHGHQDIEKKSKLYAKYVDERVKAPVVNPRKGKVEKN